MVRYEGDRPVAVEKVLISAHRQGQGPGRDATGGLRRRGGGVMPETCSDPISNSSSTRRDDSKSGPVWRYRPHRPQDHRRYLWRLRPSRWRGLSGKDATKVDRSAAYGARWAAKNIVASGIARKAEIQLSYAIGQAEPFSIHVETFGTEVLTGEDRNVVRRSSTSDRRRSSSVSS